MQVIIKDELVELTGDMTGNLKIAGGIVKTDHITANGVTETCRTLDKFIDVIDILTNRYSLSWRDAASSLLLTFSYAGRRERDAFFADPEAIATAWLEDEINDAKAFYAPSYDDEGVVFDG